MSEKNWPVNNRTSANLRVMKKNHFNNHSNACNNVEVCHIADTIFDSLDYQDQGRSPQTRETFDVFHTLLIHPIRIKNPIAKPQLNDKPNAAPAPEAKLIREQL